jgi:DhnA family fructose-bisphosphate aldolase class Ia
MDRRTNRTLIIALDHGIHFGPVSGIENLGETIRKVIEGGPDGLLLSPGAAATFSDLLLGRNAPSVVLRADRYSVKPDAMLQIASATGAASLGADALIIFMIAGFEDDNVTFQNIEHVARFGSECKRIGMPLIVEVTAWGSKIPEDEKLDVKYLQPMARQAAELGADLLKIPYPEDMESFRKILRTCPVPCTVLGGPKTEKVRDFLQSIKDAVDAGAAGATVGRNVWAHENPVGMVRALRMIIHENSSVDMAAKQLT